MCGICGYIDAVQISAPILEHMNDMLTHRGPDDSGVWDGKLGDFNIGLAHKRLAILDLSASGHQPMISKDGNLTLVFNGEIYNYKELRDELKKQGHQFVTECDTEVIIEAYQEWGINFLNRMNGMFALALCDLKKKIAILGRDRIGKKPLYYYYNSLHFVFASELKAIMQYPVFQKIIRHDIIAKFLCYQYINEPDTIFENTYKLSPGHYLIWQNGSIEKHTYWDICESFQNNNLDIITEYTEAKEGLQKLLDGAVQKRMIADVPLGTFLSGGIDSSLVTALAQKNSMSKINTYSIGFEDKERDEAPYAKEIASFLGTNHTEVYINEKSMLNMINEISHFYDEPFADPSQIPTMLVAEVAKSGITVALSGDGGDEIFCGYSMYDYLQIAQKTDNFTSVLNKVMTVPILRNIKKTIPNEVKALLENRDKDYKVQLFADLPESFVKKMLLIDFSSVKYPIEKNLKTNIWQEKRMLLDMLTYLPEDILTKTDRASMRCSLEVRCPLLDYELIEYSFRIPHKYKYHNRNKKHILKDITYDFIPKELLDRPKKGFGVPLGRWLRGYLKQEVLQLADENKLKRQGIFNYEAIIELIEIVSKTDKKPYPKLLWAFYIFQLWYNRYIGFE